MYDLRSHIVRRMTTFLMDRTQREKLGNEHSHASHPNEEVPQESLSGPKLFLV